MDSSCGCQFGAKLKLFQRVCSLRRNLLNKKIEERFDKFGGIARQVFYAGSTAAIEKEEKAEF